MYPLSYMHTPGFVALLLISIIFWPPKNKAFRRRGIDPGFGNLKVWPARIWFLWKGKDIVDQAYLHVGINNNFFLKKSGRLIYMLGKGHALPTPESQRGHASTAAEVLTRASHAARYQVKRFKSTGYECTRSI
jgi:hypothetical protein